VLVVDDLDQNQGTRNALCKQDFKYVQDAVTRSFIRHQIKIKKKDFQPGGESLSAEAHHMDPRP